VTDVAPRSAPNAVLPAAFYARPVLEVARDLVGCSFLFDGGGGPTPDKPDMRFSTPPDPRTASHEMIIAVPDCRAAYEELLARGTQFLTPPVEYEWEIRCFFRDPDGHLLELSEARHPADA